MTLAKAEELGNEGNVDESLKLMEKVTELNGVRDKLEVSGCRVTPHTGIPRCTAVLHCLMWCLVDRQKVEFKAAMPPSMGKHQQKLRVCEVCSAYLSIFDNDRR